MISLLFDSSVHDFCLCACCLVFYMFCNFKKYVYWIHVPWDFLLWSPMRSTWGWERSSSLRQQFMPSNNGENYNGKKEKMAIHSFSHYCIFIYSIVHSINAFLMPGSARPHVFIFLFGVGTLKWWLFFWIPSYFLQNTNKYPYERNIEIFQYNHLILRNTDCLWKERIGS